MRHLILNGGSLVLRWWVNFTVVAYLTKHLKSNYILIITTAWIEVLTVTLVHFILHVQFLLFLLYCFYLIISKYGHGLSLPPTPSFFSLKKNWNICLCEGRCLSHRAFRWLYGQSSPWCTLGCSQRWRCKQVYVTFFLLLSL